MWLLNAKQVHPHRNYRFLWAAEWLHRLNREPIRCGVAMVMSPDQLIGSRLGHAPGSLNLPEDKQISQGCPVPQGDGGARLRNSVGLTYSGLEVLPDMYWLPEAAPPLPLDAVTPDELCDMEYKVVHYTPQSCGRAFGPLGFDQMVCFCYGLQERLRQGQVVLATRQGDEAARMNAAVFLGSFLILRYRWSLEEVEECLGQEEAGALFPCSWGNLKIPEPTRWLRVKDCWEGIAYADKHGWFNSASVQACNESIKSKVCQSWRTMIEGYDASWIVKDWLLVCADPITTATDPNPCTFKRMYPNSTPMETHLEDTAVAGTNICGMDNDFDARKMSEGESDERPTAACSDTEDVGDVISSVCTVNKDYNQVYEHEMLCSVRLDFVSFLNSCNAKLLVRANHKVEPGLQNSYDKNILTEHGIDHCEACYKDVRGAVPPKHIITEVLSRTKRVLDNCEGAVAIHCKGGFGRSLMLACAVILNYFDVPGRALLGWVRIVRPGAITTVQQEACLSMEFCNSKWGSKCSKKSLDDMNTKACCSMM